MVMRLSGSLVVVGSANIDMVVSTSRFPIAGETILGKSFHMFPGGKGANQAVCAAKLGGEVQFIGRMGDDIFRDRLFESMHKDGVDLLEVLIDRETSTGIALIMVDDEGRNEIVVVPGSNMNLSPRDIDSKADVISAARVVLMQLEIPLETVIHTAKNAKKNAAAIILNPAPARELPERLFSLVDYLTPNESEAEMLTGIRVTSIESAGKAARSLMDRGVSNVIVTLGEKGSLFVNDRCEKHFPAVSVKPVDTTAAGDAFNGAFALSIVKGMEIDDGVRFATTVAALSVTRMGAQSSMPTPEELHSFLVADSP
jgi:ribokinase